MRTLWFIVPAHGRLALTEVCLRQLRRTCDALTAHGLEATAAVIADDSNLDRARELGFATIERDNVPLGRKWNDGYELACNPDFNPRPADYVVPMGSDDWIDPALILSAPLPADDEITCFRRLAFVSEDATSLLPARIMYPGGAGIRIVPRALVAAARYRPAEEDRMRALDASTLRGFGRALKAMPRLIYHDLRDVQIVDWKSRASQLNSFEMCEPYADGDSRDPFEALAGVYPAVALDEMRALYQAYLPVAA